MVTYALLYRDHYYKANNVGLFDNDGLMTIVEDAIVGLWQQLLSWQKLNQDVALEFCMV